ncbi:cobalamin biosynthesis protein CobW [Litchfieldella qijiaojingensis]|uniref:Cobalamin biosynthesis protein CobW n=1 Tax=Litchfieldella qijiaojingensis TaxID=980347 RepID=A0ABQ2YCX7_9GAMM|nr:cobalamin biosynthesis protein CobW [Halomonas qijiaojingensis]
MHVITGFLGSGKSTLIRHLVAHKPRHERWVIVINEFGQVGIDQAMFEEDDDVIVKGLPGGCMCCQLAFVLQASLVNLIHRHRPDRLIVEPSGLGHPAGLLEMLRGEAFADALQLQEVIALLDPRRLDDPRSREHDTFQDQLLIADGVALTMTDLASREQRQAAWRYLENMWPPKRWVLEACHGRMPVSLLIEGHRHAREVEMDAHPGANAHRILRNTAPLVSLDEYRYREPAPGKPICERAESLGHASLGWRWHPDDRFSLDALTVLLDRLPPELRIKGVLHTDAGWKLYNRADGRATLTSSVWRRDSRLELIGPPPQLPLVERLEARLAACRDDASAQDSC